jgi:hypothetical protein
MIKDQYSRLIEAYSDKNLNRITGKLIDLYRSGRHEQLSVLANKISDYVQINSENPGRCFSGLVLLYHPDRGEYYRKMINECRENGEGLAKFSHIHLVEAMEVQSVSILDEDIDYDPEYKWEDNRSGYNYFFESDEYEKDPFDEDPVMQHATSDIGIENTEMINTGPDTDYEKSFYNIVKLRMYGNIDTEFPAHYLEDFEDVEFAESQMETLDGIEHCKHVTMLDLGGNQIHDISELWNLNRLEEVYLADNRISIIDALSNLTKLRILDLSGNQIDDISALFELENLEFVNLLGNNIPENQLRKMRENKIVLMHE